MNHLTNYKNTKAFTLVELMVVIIIIGILAAIAVPSYQKYTTNAKMSEAYALIDGIGKSQLKYFSDNSEFYNLNQLNPLNLDTKTIIQHTTWDGLGYPIAVGSNVNFTYRSWAGKFDSSGTELFNVGDSISGLGFTQLTNTSITMSRHVDGTACNANTVSPPTMGIVASRGLNWAITVAVADMNNDYSSTCTAVIRTLESSSNTQNNPAFSGGFVVMNSGE